MSKPHHKLASPGYPCQIVIAWLEDGAEVVPNPARRTDLGEAPRLRPCRVPHAARWLNEGIEADVSAAERYAAGEGRTVLCYGMDVDDVLDTARTEMMRRGGGER